MKIAYKHVSGTKGPGDDDALERYKWLQLVLFFAHFACAIAIVVINSITPKESFRVGYNFRYNLWDTNGDETCESGCDITAEVYEFPAELNVNLLVSFFSFVSGTNHLIQFAAASGWLGASLFNTWLDRGYFWIRSVDFGVSAGLMLLANSILFYAPPDFQTLVLFFLVQALTQLGGYCAEVLLVNGLQDEAKNAFWVAGLLYIVVWSLRFGMFFLTIKDGILGKSTVNTAPIQVWFFLAWIFQTFMLFPLALWKKIRENDATQTLKWEIVYSLLSFLAKLPLLAVFIGGSFQRSLFTDIVDGTSGTTTTSSATPSAAFSGETYLALFLPMGLALLGSAVIVYFFFFDLGFTDAGTRLSNFFQVGKVAGLCSLYLVATTLVAFIPVLIGLAPGMDATTVTYLSVALPPFLVTLAWQYDLRH